MSGITFIRTFNQESRFRSTYINVSDAYVSVMKLRSHKRQKVWRFGLSLGDNQDPDVDADTPVIAVVNTDKGGPRASLYDICKRLQWTMPSFELAMEHKSRTPIEFGEGANRRQGSNMYVSRIALHISNFGVIEATGEQIADKKSSQDSAALCLIYKLEELGKLVIGCS